VQFTLFQLEGAVNRVEHVAEREINGGVLRIQPQCHILRGCRHADDAEKYRIRDNLPVYAASAKCPSIFFFH